MILLKIITLIKCFANLTQGRWAVAVGAAVEGAVVEGEGKRAGLEHRGAVGVGAAVLANGCAPAGYKSLRKGRLT